MIISLRRGLRFIRFIIVFAGLVYLFYHVLDLFNGWISPVDKYQMPTGNAVKVFRRRIGQAMEKHVLRWRRDSVCFIGMGSSPDSQGCKYGSRLPVRQCCQMRSVVHETDDTPMPYTWKKIKGCQAVRWSRIFETWTSSSNLQIRIRYS